AGWQKVMRSLIRQLGAQLVQTERRLGGVASVDTRTRLAGELHRLAHEAGEDVPGGGRRLPAAVTHADLARQIGASRETVTRLLASLQAEGYIRREGRRLVVADPAKLAGTFELSDEERLPPEPGGQARYPAARGTNRRGGRRGGTIRAVGVRSDDRLGRPRPVTPRRRRCPTTASIVAVGLRGETHNRRRGSVRPWPVAHIVASA